MTTEIKRAGGTAVTAIHPLILASPYLTYLLAVFGIPLVYIGLLSVGGGSFGLHNYSRALAEPTYIRVILNTFVMALVVTGMCILAGYPLAVMMRAAGPTLRRCLLFGTLLPFWTSILVKSYVWLVLLQAHGVVNTIAIKLGVTTEPFQLIYGSIGVIVGMTYALLPYMVLALYASLKMLDESLFVAAATLGAGPTTTFWRITFPLSMPGLLGGGLLVFILALGFFITPALLGGLEQTTIGMVIEAQFNRLLDWGFGSALAVLLTLSVLFIAIPTGRWLRLGLEAGAR